MRYIFDDLKKIKETIGGKSLFLFLDCDGTLAPIVNTPDKVEIPQETKELLRLLSQKDNCRIAIISGRSLGDLKRIVGLNDIIYSGVHGFQIEGPKLKYELAVPAGYIETLQSIKARLKEKLSGIKGVLIEDKKLSLVLHFRLVDKEHLAFIESVFHESVISCLGKNKIQVKPGKKIFEIRPALNWDKGKVVLWLLARQKFVQNKNGILPVYIGDDVTDEDAFKALKNKGLTVVVGKPANSEADYYLENTKEVTRFLRFISDSK
ncbi:MAG: trehalose-phosphatase [Candidatus Omnitrophica bacterium]|nr:trehalose-phosphatase [Candidatus Omnitrophota bacterium]